MLYVPPVDDNDAYSTLVATTGKDLSANLAASQAQVVGQRVVVEDLQGQLATAVLATAAAEESLAESSAKNKALQSELSKMKKKWCADQKELEKLKVLKTTWWGNGREEGIKIARTEAANSAAEARELAAPLPRGPGSPLKGLCLPRNERPAGGEGRPRNSRMWKTC